MLEGGTIVAVVSKRRLETTMVVSYQAWISH